MNINFELYKVFYHVASTLSFSEASEKLFISQSAVSQSIKLLEEKMNCTLFFRNTKQVKLTSEGKILFRHIEQAYHFIKSGERNISEMHDLQQGEIRIGASDTICKYYLLPYFKAFSKAFPRIKIHVTNRTSQQCIELLRRGKVDFSVINVPEKIPYPHMKIQELKKIRDVFIAGDSFHDLKDRKVSIDELVQYPVLMLEKEATTRIFFDTFLKEKGIQITPEIELGSVDLLIELTKIGLGISFVPTDYIVKEIANHEIFPIQLQEEIPSRHLGILTYSNLPLPIAAEKFIGLLAGPKKAEG